ncbi:MAG TPA: flagellar hook-basal body complex protein, partial [Xanthomonadaceae bacterium]
VMGFDANGNLSSIDSSSSKTLPAQATTSVNFAGNLSPSSTTTPVDFSIYDAQGTAHSLTATFTNNATGTPPMPGNYTVTVTDETGATVGTGQIQFDINGTLESGSSQINLSLTYGGAVQPVTLNFGTPGSLNGTVSLATSSTPLAAQTVDGHGVLGRTSMSFDENGVLQLSYAGSETRQGPQIALATFQDENALHMDAGRLLSGAAISQRTLGRPNAAGFGGISAGSLEMSNVDLTQEFADMIIIERGYQASSRVMTVSNDMLEQLYNSTRGG